MSELIEINADNCVLSENEMELIDDSFGEYWREFLHIPAQEAAKHKFDIMFLKINKLNDIVKEKNHETKKT